MSSIPEEIYLDIFLRLPVKSVLACKCVCKTFYSMISNLNFIKSHLNLSIQNNNYSLMLNGYGEDRSPSPGIMCSISYDALSALPRNDVVDNVIEFEYPFYSLNNDVTLLCSCNGLVYLRVLNMFGKSFLCLWNPCTKEFKEIPDSPNQVLEEEIGVSAYAFGYDSNIDDYKLVKVLQPYDSDTSLVDVYTVGSNSWRSIEDIPYRFLSEQRSGVLVNQAFHWLGCKSDSQVEEITGFIVSLDISNERFEEMPLPKVPCPLGSKQLFKCWGVLEGRLCVLVDGGFSKVVVWVMQDYGVLESWTKHFDIMDEMIWEYCFMSLMWFFKNDEVLLYNEGDLVLYDSKHASVRKPEIPILSSLEVEIHVESLVSLNSGTYVGR